MQEGSKLVRWECCVGLGTVWDSLLEALRHLEGLRQERHRRKSSGRAAGPGRNWKGVLRHIDLSKTSAGATQKGDPGPQHLPTPNLSVQTSHLGTLSSSLHTERPSVHVCVTVCLTQGHL